MQIAIASSYREGSIAAITAEASRTDQLKAFFTTASLSEYSRKAERLPLVGKRLSMELRRRSFDAVNHKQTRCVALVPELIHVSVRRIVMGYPRIAASMMYWAKAEFDSSVAKQITKVPCDTVIGMWGTCHHTFASAKNRFKVLNYINSRPREHNRYLRELAGLPHSNGEMVPDTVAANVEREMEIADLILVPSHFVANQMPEYASKVRVVPYGVNIRQFEAPERNYPHKEHTFLFVGQISHRKGVVALLAASKNIPDAKFVMVGPLVDRTLVNNLPKNVTYKGNTPHDQIPRLMREADAFIAPSLEDSYSLVTLEAMASGLPVIVSQNCGASELITHGLDGLIIKAGNVDELTSSIRTIIESPKSGRQIGALAREKVRTKSTWQQYSRAVLLRIESGMNTTAGRLELGEA